MTQYTEVAISIHLVVNGLIWILFYLYWVRWVKYKIKLKEAGQMGQKYRKSVVFVSKMS